MAKLIVGNWKMNGLPADLAHVGAVRDGLPAGCEAMLCPPATLIERCRAVVAGSALRIGAQDCHPAANGAHTGDLSAEMLAAAGAEAVIVGHSERRQNHREDGALVAAKAAAAHRAGLLAIVCIGETQGEREAGETLAVLRRQFAQSLPASATPANTVIAYEPVWAIGTGLVASLADVAEAHGALRDDLRSRFGADGSDLRMLYGGSVKADNAAGLLALADVDGALVGGASLKPSDFLAILSIAAAASVAA
jgi:triosephosphate isomerase